MAPAGPEVHHLFQRPIADHSFSADKQLLAVAKDSAIEIYRRAGNEFKLQSELRAHEKLVTGVDIAPISGRIVTCSQDRNAYIWEPNGKGGWNPSIVLLRSDRAATCVRFSPSERKFATGSGDRSVAISCKDGDEWRTPHHLRKGIRSTITCLAWHPNSVLLAAGGTDSHARVYSTFIAKQKYGADLEKPSEPLWGHKLSFGVLLGEYLNNAAGWVHGVAFSPSGNALAFVGHDSTLTVAYPNGENQPPRAVVSVIMDSLPLISLVWTSEDEIIAAGFDCEAYKFRGTAEGWDRLGPVAKKVSQIGHATPSSALSMFKHMDLKGSLKDDTVLTSVHQNAIRTVRVYEAHGGGVKKFSNVTTASGADGRVVVWDV